MQLQVTRNIYKRTNLELKVSADLKQVEAEGYDWFKYVVTDKVGNILLSEYSSRTSGDHILDIKSVLSNHSLKSVLSLNFCNEYCQSEVRSIKSIHNLGHYGQNLSNPKRAINNEIGLIRTHILHLIEAIKKPRTHKRKNEERKGAIKQYLFRIKDLRNFRDNFLDKKVKKVKFTNSYFLGYRDDKQTNQEVFNAIYGNYLKCTDDRQVRYYLNSFSVPRSNRTLDGDGIALNIEKLKTLFSLNKNYDYSKIVFYSHIQDVNNSIPDNIDSIEYAEFLKIVKRLKIDKDNLNTLQLDRLHTAVINKALRADRLPSSPKNWTAYNVNEKLLKLEENLNKEKLVIKVIKNQGDLKAESRVMKHCIGHKNMGYHEKILFRNYQALNYKGFTFFLNPDLSISQTHGKHNSYTPDSIKQELTKLIS